VADAAGVIHADAAQPSRCPCVGVWNPQVAQQSGPVGGLKPVLPEGNRRSRQVSSFRIALLRGRYPRRLTVASGSFRSAASRGSSLVAMRARSWEPLKAAPITATGPPSDLLV
jgi:hypothetical protein